MKYTGWIFQFYLEGGNTGLRCSSRAVGLWIFLHFASGARRCAVPHVPVVAASAHGTGHARDAQLQVRTSNEGVMYLCLCVKLTLLAACLDSRNGGGLSLIHI